MYRASRSIKHSIIEYLIYIFVSIVIALFITVSPYKFIILQKDQILNLYSFELQILIGCFTVITTVYIFYINNLDKVIDDDDSNKKEGLSYLKQLFFKNLLSVFLIPLLLSIIMLLGIIFLDSKNDKCILFFVNYSITLLVFSLYSFITYQFNYHLSLVCSGSSTTSRYRL